ncbi:tRNA (guanosine(18)-2'-O)-methyltransferase TARBP1-like [Glandiceps talaboti]
MAAPMTNTDKFCSAQSFLKYANVDVCVLLDSLTKASVEIIQTNGDACEKLERLSALGAVINDFARNGPRPRGAGSSSDMNEGTQVTCVKQVEKVITSVCIPALKDARQGFVHERQSGADFQLVHVVCELTVSCLRFGKDSELQSLRDVIFMMGLKSLQKYCQTAKVSDHDREKFIESSDDVNVLTALELYNYFYEGTRMNDENPPHGNITISSVWSERLFVDLIHVLQVTNDRAVCAKIIGVLLPKLLQCSPDLLPRRLEMIWQQVSMNESDIGSYDTGSASLSFGNHDNAFLILCGVADFFFPTSGKLVDGIPDLKSMDKFWQNIQVGLTHSDALTRKRAMYLLKRVLELCRNFKLEVRSHSDGAGDKCPVFWWRGDCSKKLQQMWQDFILMIEALEETQYHIFKPLMPRLNHLINATRQDDSTEHPYLHSSWLTVLFQRCFVHVNKNSVVKWAVLEFLKLDFKKCPLLQQGYKGFVYGRLLKTLNDSGLYAQSTESLSPVGIAIIAFFKSCVDSYDTDTDKVDFIKHLPLALQQQKGWGSLPMSFVAQGLAEIDVYQAWDDVNLQIIRNILSSSIQTFPSHLKAAVSCYIIKAVLNLINTSQVTLYQFAVVIATVENLTRGSQLWNEVTEWLANHGKELKLDNSCENIGDALHKQVQCFMNEKQYTQESTKSTDIVDVMSVGVLTKVLLIISDSHYTTQEYQGLLCGLAVSDCQPLNVILQPMQDTLCRINSHAYLPAGRAGKGLQLFLHIIKEITAVNTSHTQTGGTTLAILYIVETCLEEILAYIMRKVTMETNELSDVASLNMFVEIIDVLSDLLSESSSAIFLLQDTLTKMADLALVTLTMEGEKDAITTQMKKLVGVSCLSCVCHHYRGKGDIPTNIKRILSQINLNQQFERPSGDIDVSKKDFGKLVSLYEERRWKCVTVILEMFGGSWNSQHQCQDLLKESVDVLNIISGPAILSVIKCMKLLIQLVLPSDSSLCVLCLDVIYTLVYDTRRDSGLFWPAYQAMINTVFQDDIFAAEPNTDIYAKVDMITNQICELAENKSGVLYLLVERYCQYVEGMKGDKINHLNLLVEACTYGPIRGKDHRIREDCLRSLKVTSEGKPASQVIYSVIKPDSYVRTLMISTLCRFIATNSAGRSAVVMEISKRLLTKADMVTQTRKHYLLNSRPHRIKQRIWQTLLILQPAFDKCTSELVMREALKALSWDTQLSVKTLEEWFIVLIVYRYPEYQTILWDKLKEDVEKTVNFTSSILAMIAILASVSRSVDEQELFLNQALPLTMTHTMAGNFTIRLYAQAALQKVFNSCQQSNMMPLLAKYPGIQECMKFLQHNPRSSKLKTKLLGNFFFFKFDPVKDYSVETIFHTLPRLCNVVEEELISPDTFHELTDLWSSQNPLTIQLLNSRDDLKMCEHGKWKERDTNEDDGDDENVNTGDVQKKMMPWTDPALHQDMEGNGSHDNRKAGKLVVVTSLINKLPNLGGLCRTSEIFGVGTFVVGNLKYCETQEFQSLSVTAEKWLPLEEVKAAALKTYLLEMKKQGYSLVGVEQTANSICLTEYKFPEKTLLILGNEKEGLPVELIQLLDKCVEIPQLGQIRSLNVHVSGALLIWEYARQQLL